MRSKIKEMRFFVRSLPSIFILFFEEISKTAIFAFKFIHQTIEFFILSEIL